MKKPKTAVNLWSLIKSEPYRLFFPLGLISGLIGVTYWLLVSAQITSGYDPLFHGLIQIELFASAFAVGFLLTALPKFLRTDSASNTELLFIVGTYLALAASVLSNARNVSQICFILMLLLLVRFAILRAKQRKASPPDSFLLVGFGLLQGLLGALSILLPSPLFPLLGQKMLEQGMFLSLSLGIGCFLGPRLMGIVDVTNAVLNIPGARSAPKNWLKDARFAVCMYGLGIFVSFFLETGLHRELGLYLRAITATACLFHFGVLKIPRSQSLVGILVALALWLMILGLWITALLPGHEVSALHITYIGGFGLLILSIGGQVASSHGGYPAFWKVQKNWALLATALVLFATMFRLFATLLSGHYFLFLGISAFCFDIALILWALGLYKYLFKTS